VLSAHILSAHVQLKKPVFNNWNEVKLLIEELIKKGK